MSLNMKIMRVERENETLKEELITATNDFMELKKENEKLKKENEKLREQKKNGTARRPTDTVRTLTATRPTDAVRALAARRSPAPVPPGRALAARNPRGTIPDEYLNLSEFADSPGAGHDYRDATYGEAVSNEYGDFYELPPVIEPNAQLYEPPVELYDPAEFEFGSPLRISRTKKHKTRRKTSPKRRKTSPKRRKTSPKRRKTSPKRGRR